MSLTLLLLFLGVANWLATLILVESEVTRDYREWIGRRADYANEFPIVNPLKAFLWHKLRYLVGCHLCTGTWVGFLMALFITPIVSVPVIGTVLTGLVIKGIGHLFLVIHKAGESYSTHKNQQINQLQFEHDKRLEFYRQETERQSNVSTNH